MTLGTYKSVFQPYGPFSHHTRRPQKSFTPPLQHLSPSTRNIMSDNAVHKAGCLCKKIQLEATGDNSLLGLPLQELPALYWQCFHVQHILEEGGEHFYRRGSLSGAESECRTLRSPLVKKTSSSTPTQRLSAEIRWSEAFVRLVDQRCFSNRMTLVSL